MEAAGQSSPFFLPNFRRKIIVHFDTNFKNDGGEPTSNVLVPMVGT
jgi:hypothetical protein